MRRLRTTQAQGLLVRGLVIGLTLGAYWLLCFQPFNWVSPISLETNAAVVAADGKLSLPRAGLALPAQEWVGRLDWPAGPQHLKLEVLARSLQAQQFGPARLVTFSKGVRSRNFTLGQSGNDLYLRLRRPGSSDNGMPDLIVADVFNLDGLVRIEFELGGGAMSLSVDGVERMRLASPQARLRDWDPHAQWALGNETTFDRPWIGELLSVRLALNDGQWIDLLQNLSIQKSHLLISERLRRWRSYLVIPFTQWKASYGWSDTTLNIIGFVPFGLLLAWLGAQPVALMRGACWALLLSLSIEVGQIAFADRHPSTTDLLLNTLGGILGVRLGNALLSKWPHLQSN